MIRTALHNFETGETRIGGLALLDQWTEDNCWVWLDFDQEDLSQHSKLLLERFDVHQLAITDATRKRHPPKFEDFRSHIFVLLRGLDATTENIEHTTIQLAFFLGPRFLVTATQTHSVCMHRAWDEMEAGQVDMGAGPLNLFCRISRVLVDRFSPLLLNLEQRLEELEEEMFNAGSDEILEELFNYNRNLKQLRRTLAYQSKLLDPLLDNQLIPHSRNVKHQLNDIDEHFERLSSLCTLNQELVVDLINGYLSLSAHRLNRVMKILTVFTVIFLPLTLIAGVYGMNFGYMPELQWRYGYFLALGLMAAVVLASMALLRKLKWL